MDSPLPDGTSTTTTFNEVLYVPELSTGLISVARLASKGAEVLFRGEDCLVSTRSGSQVLRSTVHRGQYILDLLEPTANLTHLSTPKYNDDTLKLWHRRLGHIGMEDLKRLASKIATGIDLTHAIKHQNICSSCIKKWSQNLLPASIQTLEDSACRRQ